MLNRGAACFRQSGHIEIKEVVALFKQKIHDLILFALFITSMTWLLSAYKSYSNNEISLGVVYTVLFVFLFGLATWGYVSNKNLERKSK